MSFSDIISITALIAAILSAFFAYKSSKAAIKANDIGRLDALLALRKHYRELMDMNGILAEQLKGLEGGEKANEECAKIDSKLREISKEIDFYHNKLIRLKNSVYNTFC